MQKKIRAVSEGDFERVFPLPSFEPETIEESGTEGNDIEGTLTIRGASGESLSGCIYSSNPYVTVEPLDFSGTEVRVSYTAETRGFYPGEKAEGHFTIVTDGYENTVPYSFTVEERPVFVGSRRISDLKEFAFASEKNQTDAVAAFASADFKNFLIRHHYDTYLSYRALTSTMGFTRLSLESFLTENGLKDSIRIHIFPENLSFYSVSDDVRESFRVTRNTEGYMKLHFSVPEDSFAELDMTEADDNDFYGGTLEVPFFIKKDKLHEGINRTELTVSGNGFSVTKIIQASTYGRGEQVHAKHLEKKQVIVKALNSYLDFRLRKTDALDFLKGAEEVCEYFLNENQADCFALCYRTMAQIVAGEKKQAIVSISMLKEMISDKNSFEWAFLLYLCTLMDPNEEYIDRITEEIEQISNAHPDDSRIFWFLLFLRKRYTDAPLERLKDLRQWIIRGVNSPIFYAEALDMLNAFPYMIGQLDSFSLSILRFGLRRDAISKSVISSICECLYDLKSYSQSVYDFADALYQKFMDPSLLEAIVAYLLRNRCIGEKYLLWYKRGIETGLNLTGLFESYIYSVDNDNTDILPRMLTMYFAYENNLPDDKREFLYANVVTYKEKRPSVYEIYLKQIERFAIEKLQSRKIDDNLAIIYRDMYDRGFFDRNLLATLKSLKNSVKIICMTQETGELYVFTRKKKTPIRAMLSDNSAVIDVDEEEFFPVLVTNGGTLSGKESFYSEKMLPGIADDTDNQDTDEEKDIIFALSEEADDGYTQRFFMDISPELLRSQDALVCALPYEAGSLKNLPPEESSFIIRNLISQNMMSEAYSAVREVNGLNVADNQLLRLFTWKCTENEKDDFLTAMLSYLLKNLLSNADTLDYLCRYYSGPTEDMLSLFRYANARECDVRALCERIICQMIYEEGNESSVRTVYRTYSDLGGDRTIINAFLSCYADRYIRGRASETDEKFFKDIREMYDREDINQTLSTALLKHYSTIHTLPDDDLSIAFKLLCENLMAGRYFAFYKKLDLRLVVKTGLYEKMIVEYADEPGHTFDITVRGDELGEKTDEMSEVYDGIYVYTFILFRGEKVSYTITDSSGNVKRQTSVTNQDYLDEIKDSRFGRLGTIYEEKDASNEALSSDVNDYIRLDVSGKDLFSMV
ncbi:MAG: DUF5717 family protein [Lachnospiraceae bacterium]|nr:DUF5717 family protein [Lachnospiraceae bacterium]